MYDDFPMGLVNSNQRPGLPYNPDNILMSQASAPILEEAGGIESKMSINATWPVGVGSPPKTAGKELTQDEGTADE